MEYDGAAECLELGTGTIEGCDQCLLALQALVQLGLEEFDVVLDAAGVVAQFTLSISWAWGVKGELGVKGLD
jgi:hypothetical protein